MDNQDSTTRKEEVNEAALADPWATQREIAEDLGVSRVRVSQLLDDESKAVREAYRNGVEVDATPGMVRSIANVLRTVGDVEMAVAHRILQSAEDDDVDAVRLELVPADREADDG